MEIVHLWFPKKSYIFESIFLWWIPKIDELSIKKTFSIKNFKLRWFPKEDSYVFEIIFLWCIRKIFELSIKIDKKFDWLTWFFVDRGLCEILWIVFGFSLWKFPYLFGHTLPVRRSNIKNLFPQLVWLDLSRWSLGFELPWVKKCLAQTILNSEYSE